LWYNGGMDIVTWLKDWGLPLSAGATFLLAIAAFVAIWQNRRSHEIEMREKRLETIIDWAVAIRVFAFESNIKDSATLYSTELERYFYGWVVERKNHLMILIQRGDSREGLARKFFGSGLKAKVDELLKALVDNAELHARYLMFLRQPITPDTFNNYRKAIEHIVKIDEDTKGEKDKTELKLMALGAIQNHMLGETEEAAVNVINHATNLMPR